MVTTGDSRQTVVPITGPGGAPVGNKMPGGRVKEVAGLEGADNLLADVERLYKPDFVGPIAGYASQAQFKIPGTKLPEGLADFRAALTAQKNWFIKAITGAAMSEPEAKRIMSQIPDWTNKPEQFMANLNASRKNAQFLIQRMMELSGAAPGGAPSKETTKGPAEGTEGVVQGVPAVWKTVNGKTGWYAK
jgi:hypothetical protein